MILLRRRACLARGGCVHGGGACGRAALWDTVVRHGCVRDGWLRA